MKKFDLVNPVIGKLATQVKASKLTDYELTKKLLMQGEIDQLQNRLDKLKYEKKMTAEEEIVAVEVMVDQERQVLVY